jgi:hypothetical protein
MLDRVMDNWKSFRNLSNSLTRHKRWKFKMVRERELTTTSFGKRLVVVVFLKVLRRIRGKTTVPDSSHSPIAILDFGVRL